MHIFTNLKRELNHFQTFLERKHFMHFYTFQRSWLISTVHFRRFSKAKNMEAGGRQNTAWVRFDYDKLKRGSKFIKIPLCDTEDAKNIKMAQLWAKLDFHIILRRKRQCKIFGTSWKIQYKNVIATWYKIFR